MEQQAPSTAETPCTWCPASATNVHGVTGKRVHPCACPGGVHVECFNYRARDGFYFHAGWFGWLRPTWGEQCIRCDAAVRWRRPLLRKIAVRQLVATIPLAYLANLALLSWTGSPFIVLGAAWGYLSLCAATPIVEREGWSLRSMADAICTGGVFLCALPMLEAAAVELLTLRMFALRDE
jgi:hypothetical protein